MEVRGWRGWFEKISANERNLTDMGFRILINVNYPYFSNKKGLVRIRDANSKQTS